MALTQIRIGSLDNFHQYDDAVYATGAEFSQPIIAGDATAATHLLTRNNLWGGTNYINGNLLINTGDALGVADVGLVVGDIGAGTGWVLNAKGQGSWVTGLSLHGQSLAAGVAWQRETVGGLEPIDPAFVMDLGDQVIGGYNYKVTATGAYVGGAQWDQSARQFNVRGHLTALSLAVGSGISITIDTTGSYGSITFTNVAALYGIAAPNVLYLDPLSNNSRDFYTGLNGSKFHAVITNATYVQWFDGATQFFEATTSGIDVKVGTISVGGVNISTIYAAAGHNHSGVYAPVSHDHTGHNLTPTSITCTGRVRSDMSDNAAGYFPNGGVTANSFWVGAGGYHDEIDDLAAIRAIKPLMENDEPVRDEKGSMCADLASYPLELLSPDKKFFNAGNAFGLTFGAIKALEARLAALETSIKI